MTTIASLPPFVLYFVAALMLVLAAFVEAFWSSTRMVPPPVKYVVGGAFWVLVFAYLTFAGRGRGGSQQP